MKKANKMIKHLENEGKNFKNEIKELNEDVDSLVTHINDQEISTCEEKEPEKTNGGSKQEVTNSCHPTNLTDSGIDLKSLTKLIDERIEEKLWNCEPQITSSSEEEIVQKVFTRTGSLAQINQRTLKNNAEKREQNIIIHGIDEGKYTEAQYLAEFFDVLELDLNSMCASHRLGTKQNDRIRPLKIIMKSVKEKVKVMSRLGRLKGADEVFKKISVTDDYTMEEREEIKRWVIMAKEKNMTGTKDYVWKVRGTPKEGIRLALVKHQ